jgi:hypothetical protein
VKVHPLLTWHRPMLHGDMVEGASLRADFLPERVFDPMPSLLWHNGCPHRMLATK